MIIIACAASRILVYVLKLLASHTPESKCISMRNVVWTRLMESIRNLWQPQSNKEKKEEGAKRFRFKHFFPSGANTPQYHSLTFVNFSSHNKFIENSSRVSFEVKLRVCVCWTRVTIVCGRWKSPVKWTHCSFESCTCGWYEVLIDRTHYSRWSQADRIKSLRSSRLSIRSGAELQWSGWEIHPCKI